MNAVAMPVEVVSQEDLETWYKLQEQLEKIKAQEMELRKKIFTAYFPNPVEGTNSAPLTEGWVLKAVYPIRREPEQAALEVLKEELRAKGIPVDNLIKYKPELVTAMYRQLTDEQRNLFDQVLVIKPGSPQMEVMLPKRKAKSK